MNGASLRWSTTTVFCRCRACGDYFDVVLYLRRRPGRAARGRLEPSATVHAREGQLIHRCGGDVACIDLNEQVVLEDGQFVIHERDLEQVRFT